MPVPPLPIEQILALLSAAPPRLAALTIHLPLKTLHTAPSPGVWSANEVLAHLRACADVWGNCINTIIVQDKPTIRAINPRTWIKRTNYLLLDFHASLRDFTTQRETLLAVLQSLSKDDWSRAATITGAGRPLERSILSYAQWLAEHERPHLRQIEHIVQQVA